MTIQIGQLPSDEGETRGGGGRLTILKQMISNTGILAILSK